MFRPRDGHDLRLLETSLTISPPANIIWSYDVFGNSIATASFVDKSDFLSFDSTIRAQQFPLAETDIVLPRYVARYPWAYSADEIADFGRSNERFAPIPNGWLTPGRAGSLREPTRWTRTTFSPA
jgi:hypothetical protein